LFSQNKKPNLSLGVMISAERKPLERKSSVIFNMNAAAATGIGQ
jgi:hypothetical protein